MLLAVAVGLLATASSRLQGNGVIQDALGFLTNRNPAITTANTAKVVLYNASAGNPNANPNTARPHPARPGTKNPDTAVIKAAQPSILK